MVEEMFVNQIDLQEVKEEVTRKGFEPVYGRDQVFSKGHATTISSGHSSGRGTAYSSTSGSSSGSSFISPEGIFVEPGPTTHFSSTSMSDGRSESSIDMDSDGWSETENESFADIPFYRFVPYEEATQPYTLEEQKWRISDLLKQQWERQCFIKIGNEKTKSMLVPIVKKPEVFAFRVEEYRKKLMEKSPYSLPLEKARQAIEQRQKLLLSAPAKEAPYPDDEDFDQEPTEEENNEE
jgi:hypothetical protein